MLWYKAWRETQGRFFVCFALMMLPSYNFLLWKALVLAGEIDGPVVYYKTLYTHATGAAFIWVFAAMLLGWGGLLRERQVGSSSFTLTLPVSRVRLIAVRVGTGLLQTIALAVTPWIVNIAISVFRRTPFSLHQAACCILFLAGGGMVWFAAALLVSSLVENEYTAAAVTYALVVLSFVVSDKVDQLKELNPISLVTGLDYVDKQTYLFSGDLPWVTILGSLSVAILMVVAAMAITQRRDF